MWKVRDQVKLEKHHQECPEFNNMGEPTIFCVCEQLDAIVERAMQIMAKRNEHSEASLYL